MCDQVTIRLGYTSDYWMKKGREFFKPIAGRSKSTTNNRAVF